jgi:hypothetical protein
MAGRETPIRNLGVGDIFHAEYPNGASCICLVLSVNQYSIKSRRITTQEDIEFDRQTGIEKQENAQPVAVIDSVAPLSAEFRDVFLAMDRKFKARMAMDEKSRSELSPQELKLTDTEKKALRFIDTYYSSNPLPPA